ncbi:MAG: sigma factor-like helix-turn-helix DNA-binding protein [Granulicella sp.]
MSTARAILPKIWACESPQKASAPEPKPKTPSTAAVEPQLAFYRKYTEAMMRRYMRFSMEAGRVPSLIGQEMFRGKVTSYRVHSFDDLVIFVHDVEKCMAQLERMDQSLITRIAVQEYTHQEVATMLRVPRQTVMYRYCRAIDRLTAIFLKVQLLEPLKACQGEGDGF